MQTNIIRRIYACLLTLCVPVLLSGCFPYQNDFSCRLKDNYGHCVNMTTAYRASVSGKDPGNAITKGESKEVSASSARALTTAGGGSSPEYTQYREQMYREMANLIERPTTPMISPPKEMRTLFLPYAPNSQRDRIYMPRYVYSIVEPPRFIMGEYLYKKPELAPSLEPKTIELNKTK